MSSDRRKESVGAVEMPSTHAPQQVLATFSSVHLIGGVGMRRVVWLIDATHFATEREGLKKFVDCSTHCQPRGFSRGQRHARCESSAPSI